MSALVAMHGFWTLIFLPLAGVLAWRLAASKPSRLAAFIFSLLSVGLVAWLGVLLYTGAEFTDSIYDRFLHAIGVVFSSINVPVIQAILGTLVFINWPAAWRFQE